MRTVLKAKSHYTDAEVQQVWDQITDYVSEDEAGQAVEEAAVETMKVLGGRPDDAVYGWSGGKDSIALQVVMERAGVRRAVMGSIPNLEFRTYMDWCERHRPEGLVHYGNREIDLNWLADPKHDRFLFPDGNKDGYKWTLLGTRRAQLLYQQEHHPMVQIYGRRTKDGNMIPPTPFGIHHTARLTTYSPIRTWSHEMVLAVVHYYGRGLPPVYSWPNGWKSGTSSWPGRRVGDRDFSFAQTYGIEPDLIREAATVVPAARDWLTRAHPEDVS